MTNRLYSGGQKIELTFTVSTEAQARELDAAWREIVAGKQPRTEVLERDQAARGRWHGEICVAADRRAGDDPAGALGVVEQSIALLRRPRRLLYLQGGELSADDRGGCDAFTDRAASGSGVCVYPYGRSLRTVSSACSRAGASGVPRVGELSFEGTMGGKSESQVRYRGIW